MASLKLDSIKDAALVSAVKNKIGFRQVTRYCAGCGLSKMTPSTHGLQCAVLNNLMTFDVKDRSTCDKWEEK